MINDYSVMIKYRRGGDISIGIGDESKTVYIFHAENYYSAQDCAKELRTWLERLRRKRGNDRPVKIIEL